jgi:2,3-dihydroxy-2,3-dihydrophenylpropionate dehydrogenase/cis-2,3-dihydrobiphenyl-2,3-diol dehydrogenase
MPALEEQRVAITGGGSGLGLAIVRRFVAEGARVAVLELSAEKAAALRTEFPDGRVAVVHGDATSLHDNETLARTCVESFGGLDCFIANAGLWDFMTSLEQLPEDSISAAFDEVYAVNVKAPLLGAKAALPELRRSSGSLLITLSNAALFPGGGGPLYVSSKHAGVGLVRQLAYELAPEVRVNGIAPGGMSTDLRGPKALGQAGRAFSEMPVKEWLERDTPLRRAPEPDEYVGAFVLLASRRDGLTATGTVLDVCGGVGIRGGSSSGDR